MTIQARQDFYSDLVSVVAATSVATNGVIRDAIPADVDLPALSIQYRDGFAPSFYVGSFGLIEMSAQIDVYSYSAETVNDVIVQAMITRYNGTRFTAGSTTFQRSLITNIIHTREVDTQVYRSVVDITLYI